MKKPKVLFLVHVEEMFRHLFPDAMYVPRILRALGIYDRVVCLVSGVDSERPIDEIVYMGGYEQIDWGWGYEEDVFYDSGDKDWVIPTNSPHEWTWIPEELRDKRLWQRYDIRVGGGGREECLQDFIDILEFVGYDFGVVDGYVF